VTLTLAMRPVGAFLFGRAADRFGRRPTLIVDVLAYSVLEFASGFAPTQPHRGVAAAPGSGIDLPGR
jgi:SHS family lactate transporter-like MFS transporter